MNKDKVRAQWESRKVGDSIHAKDICEVLGALDEIDRLRANLTATEYHLEDARADISTPWCINCGCDPNFLRND